MRKFYVLSLVVLAVALAGCGGSKAAPISAASWAGTWSGQVDWQDTSSPALGDTAAVVLSTPVPCHALNCTLFISQISGTNVGPELGNVQLSGTLSISPSNGAPGSFGQAQVLGYGYNDAEPNLQWSLNGNRITITSGVSGKLLGTLTKQ